MNQWYVTLLEILAPTPAAISSFTTAVWLNCFAMRIGVRPSCDARVGEREERKGSAVAVSVSSALRTPRNQLSALLAGRVLRVF